MLLIETTTSAARAAAMPAGHLYGVRHPERYEYVGTGATVRDALIAAEQSGVNVLDTRLRVEYLAERTTIDGEHTLTATALYGHQLTGEIRLGTSWIKLQNAALLRGDDLHLENLTEMRAVQNAYESAMYGGYCTVK